MHATIMSHFGERPHDQSTWRAMWFGVSSALILPLIGFFTMIINRTLTRGAGGRPTAVSPGMLMAVISSGLAVTGLFYGIRALRNGERSWVVWVGIIISAAVAIFWAAMFIGEFVFPH